MVEARRNLAVIDVLGLFVIIREDAGRLFKALVFQQFVHELGPRVRAAVWVPGIRGGQEHLGFDLHERARHHQKFSRHLQIQVFQDIEVSQIFMRDLRDRDVRDLQVVFLDEVQKKIQRPFKNFQ